MVADVISCDKLLRHPRGLVWELISSPDMYPMFFTGVGSCETLIESTEAGPDPEYVVLSAKVKARVRLILSNTKESLAIEGVDNDGLISVRLFEERSAQTRVRITVLRAASVLPA
ncbi:acyl-CoA synthetase, partial [Staphylococcus capitis]|nr:acyl-CoA synthetase [Staphylococcus capitis]